MFIFSVVLKPIVENLHRRSATPIRRAGQCAFLGSLISTWQIFRDPKTRNFQGFRVEALGFGAGLTGDVTILFNMSSWGGYSSHPSCIASLTLVQELIGFRWYLGECWSHPVYSHSRCLMIS